MKLTYEELQVVLENDIRLGYALNITEWLLFGGIDPQSQLGMLLTNHANRCGYSSIHTTKEQLL